jgi:hypothetical protein
VSEIIARFRQRLLTLLVLVAAVSVAGCGDEEDEDDVTGTWVLEEGEGTTYLRITESTVTIYGELGACFVLIPLDIVDVDGNEYTLELQDDPGVEFLLEIRRAGDDLLLEAEGDQVRYERSAIDVDGLEICDEVGVFDPELADCESYPALTTGAAVTGALTVGDEASGGWNFDAYRLDLADDVTVRIALASDQIDPYLRVYDAAGLLLALDDDSGGDFDSLIEDTLDAGCYIVLASSFAIAETGSYTLSVTLP